jgi:hypothetical protein
MTKTEKLENTLLELGTELYRLRNQVTGLLDFKKGVEDSLSGLKALLDEKGIIDRDDFDMAIDFSKIANEIEPDLRLDPLEYEKKAH